MNFFGNNKPEEENIKEIKAQYYNMFKNAHDSPGSQFDIEQKIYDRETNTRWPREYKEIGIKINHATGKMERVPAHDTMFGFNRSTQNNVLDKLIKGYNSTNDKKTFIKSLENNDALTNARKKQAEEAKRSRDFLLGDKYADDPRKQYYDSLRHEGYRGGKKSRKLRKNKKRKTRRKNKKRKTRRKK